MGLPNEVNSALIGAAAAGGGYQIEQSLRFRGNNTYFTKTFGSSGDRRKFTLSVWVKKATVIAFSPNNTGLNFFGANSGSVSDSMNVGMNASTEAIQFYQYNSGYTGGIFSFARYRDPSAWMHMVFVWDSAQASSAADRMAVYVNNRIERPNGSESPNTGPVQNKDAAWNNSSYTHTIGGTYQTNDMYLAEAYHIDGQALDPTYFGEYDDNGVWRPIEYTGTYSGNSFYLKFDPSATNGIGHDHSGLGNNWSPTGFVTSGTSTDVFDDTPTTNYPTLNPIYTTPPYPTQQQSGTLSQGNLAITFTGVDGGNGPTFSVVPNSGKWYFEAKQTSGDNTNISLGFFGNYTASFDNAWRIVHTNGGGGFFYSFQGPESGSEPSGSVSYSSGNILGIEIDMDNSTLQFHVNGTYATKATGLSFASYAPLWIDFRRQNSSGTNNSWLFNFGQRAFEYTPTSGFKALNTDNLSAPSIKDGSKYFNTKTYTGNGSTQTITNVNFQPDLVWVKSRSQSVNHLLFDAVRGFGSGKEISSDNQNPEGGMSTNLYGYVSGVNSTSGGSFTVAAGTNGANYVNVSSQTYVGWNWLASNTSGSSNTDGSITSTVSANPTAGFSIVTWNGSAANGTVGHGLNVAPSMIIFKRRNNTTSWPVYHSTISPSNVLYLNELASQASSGNSFGSTPTAPTSTVFSVGDKGDTNYGTMVAYCFAEVEGYSKIGSYIANNSSDGPFIYCGFKPALVLLRSYNGSSGRDWLLYDSTRSTYNNEAGALTPNETITEAARGDATYKAIDFVSNGFKLRTNGTPNMNASSESYIFMAWAEHPFGGSNVSPAAAR